MEIFKILDGAESLDMVMPEFQREYVWRIEDAKKLKEAKIDVALNYFRESINAITLITKTAMLLISAEAIAGQKKVTSKCKNCGESTERSGTDLEKLKEVLDEKLVKEIYKKKGSLRNRLFHGGSVFKKGELKKVSDSIYEKIILYLKDKYELKQLQIIKDAPRSIYSVRYTTHPFIYSKLDTPNLKDLNEELMDMAEKGIYHREGGGDYEIIIDTKLLKELFDNY